MENMETENKNFLKELKKVLNTSDENYKLLECVKSPKDLIKQIQERELAIEHDANNETLETVLHICFPYCKMNVKGDCPYYVRNPLEYKEWMGTVIKPKIPIIKASDLIKLINMKETKETKQINNNFFKELKELLISSNDKIKLEMFYLVSCSLNNESLEKSKSIINALIEIQEKESLINRIIDNEDNRENKDCIEQIKNGKLAIENDDWETNKKLLKYCFPNDSYYNDYKNDDMNSDCVFFYQSKYDENNWEGCIYGTVLPTIKASELIKKIT